MGLARGRLGHNPMAAWPRDPGPQALARYQRLERGRCRCLVRTRADDVPCTCTSACRDPEDPIKVLGGPAFGTSRSCSRCRPTPPFSQGRDGGFASRPDGHLPGVPADRPSSPTSSATRTTSRRSTRWWASTAVPDPSFLWWDTRLQPRFGTVEVRVMDAQSTLGRMSRSLVALVQSLARLEARGRACRSSEQSPKSSRRTASSPRATASARYLIDPEALTPDLQRAPCRGRSSTCAARTPMRSAAPRRSKAWCGSPMRAAPTANARSPPIPGTLEHLTARLADQFLTAPPAPSSAVGQPD